MEILVLNTNSQLINTSILVYQISEIRNNSTYLQQCTAFSDSRMSFLYSYSEYGKINFRIGLGYRVLKTNINVLSLVCKNSQYSMYVYLHMIGM